MCEESEVSAVRYLVSMFSYNTQAPYASDGFNYTACSIVFLDQSIGIHFLMKLLQEKNIHTNKLLTSYLQKVKEQKNYLQYSCSTHE